MIRKFLSISILNTIRMNFHYFGFRGVLNTYILCSRNLKIKDFCGTVTLARKERGIVRIGFGEVEVIDGKYNRAIWSNKGCIYFEGDAHFCIGAKLLVKDTGVIKFGNNFILNGDIQIICRKRIIFGDNCLISWGGLIMDTDFHSIYSLGDLEMRKLNDDQEVIIGNHCWLGCNSIILKGSILNDNSVVSAGSIVRKKHEISNCILIGDVEAKENINWLY